MSLFLRTFVASSLGLGLAFSAHAAGEPPHPIIDFPDHAPSAEALQNLATWELEARRAAYVHQVGASPLTPIADLEQLLLKSLMAYDDERIRIVDLIPVMIEEYQVNPELKEDMLNFRATMRDIIEELRPQITTLQYYKPYDFRLGISYLSLMTVLQEHQSVHEQMLRDQKDPESMIGQYTLRLSEAYRPVEAAREQLQQRHILEDMRERIDNIDNELRRRQSS